MTLAGFSVVVLGLLVNVVAAALLAVTIGFYVVVYTMWLKRWTPQNIVIGGAAGALPPMIGWAAATGGVSLEPVVLFLIIFFWTPPHFWALALYRTEDYARAGVPMLPVVAGAEATRRQILLYTLLLAPLGVDALAARLCRAVLWHRRARNGRRHDRAGVSRARRAARPSRASKQMFAFSILYLFLLFAMLLVDEMSGMAWPCGMTNECGDERHQKASAVTSFDCGARSGGDRHQAHRAAVARAPARSIAIAVSLGLLVVLFYIVTLVKGPGVMDRPL